MNSRNYQAVISRIDINKTLAVFVIAFSVATLNILHVIIGFAKTTGGTIYLGTGHYYLDYFEYVQAIAQGMRGGWIWQNYFATDDPTRSIFGMWQYLLYGKVGSFFHLNPFLTYWVVNFLFSLILSVLIFVAISKLLDKEPFYKKIAAYLLCLFAGPFFRLIPDSTGMNIVTFGFWNDKNVLWERFGSVPYHIFSYILALVVLFIVSDSLEKLTHLKFRSILFKSSIVSLILIFLLSFAPSIALLLILSISFTVCFLFLKVLVKKQPRNSISLFFFLGIILILTIPISLAIKHFLSNNSYYASAIGFESTWQINVGLKDFILAVGPILIFSTLGLNSYLRRISVIRLLFLFFVLISYLFFFLPIAKHLGTTNTRFLTGLSYILFGVLAVMWVKSLKSTIILTLILLVLFLPANITSLRLIIEDRNIDSPISYLPIGILDGFTFLGKLPGKEAVLITPSQFLGSVLPIFVNRHTYVARPNATPNYVEKNIRTSNFYLRAMTDEQAKLFLLENGIKYIILTSIEGYDVERLYEYSFLKEVYKNKDIAIFTFKNK